MQFKLSANVKLRVLSVYADGWKAQKAHIFEYLKNWKDVFALHG